MKTTKFFHRLTAAVLSLSMLAGACACGKRNAAMSDGTVDLMANIRRSPRASVSQPDGEQEGAVSRDMVFRWEYWEFTAGLLRQCEERNARKENTLLSPLSVMTALSLTLNGAQGETRRQMLDTLAGSVVAMDAARPLDTDSWNAELSEYLRSLPDGRKARLASANSVWFKNDALSVSKDFLQTNADYYGADVFAARFDSDTKDDINRWVSQKTDGMVEKMLDEIPENAVMYLLNALAFDAEWKDIYRADQVGEGAFTDSDGNTSRVTMMTSEEGGYFEDGMATGFVKPYAAGFSFVALLPNEGVTVDEYLHSASPSPFNRIFPLVTEKAGGDATEGIAIASIPKFSADYAVELSDALKAMGMTDAFLPEKADFSGIDAGKPNELYIGRVLHKTAIRVDERGTKAGAATAVEMLTKGAQMHSVILDRPFLYMIVDDRYHLPVFIGIVNRIEA